MCTVLPSILGYHRKLYRGIDIYTNYIILRQCFELTLVKLVVAKETELGGVLSLVHCWDQHPENIVCLWCPLHQHLECGYSQTHDAQLQSSTQLHNCEEILTWGVCSRSYSSLGQRSQSAAPPACCCRRTQGSGRWAPSLPFVIFIATVKIRHLHYWDNLLLVFLL